MKKKSRSAVKASAAAPVAAGAKSGAAAARAPDVWVDRAIVCVATLIVFGRTLPYPLLPSWDDGRFLIDDPLVQHVSVASLRAILLEPHFEAYHPLHLLSYWVDVPWFGAVGWAVRSTNLLIFLGVGVLLLAWLRELGLGRWPALIATLAFALHPIQVELVVWGTGRKDGLAALLVLAAWLTHLRAKNGWGHAASGGLYLLACLAKTSAVPLPLAMFALDIVLERRPWRDAARIQVPGLVVAVGLGVVTLLIWSSNDMIRPVGRGGSSIVVVLATLTHAIATAAWPSAVSPLYALVDDDPPSSAQLALGLVIVLALAGLAFRARSEAWARWLVGGLVVFGALFLPVANIVPTYFHFQDRHLSLPFVGLTLVLAALLSALGGATASKPPAILAFAALALVPLAGRTLQYEEVWASDLRLWGHAASTHPRSFFAWIKLGEVRRTALHFDGAVDAYANAIEIEPSARLAYAGLLMTMVLRDERDEGIAPSRAEALTERYTRHADQPDALREDAFQMVGQGYRTAALFVLSRSLDLAPVSEERLERAAQIQLAQNREWMARFYVGRMTRRPILPTVARFFDEERDRLGIVDPPRPEGDIPLHPSEASEP